MKRILIALIIVVISVIVAAEEKEYQVGDNLVCASGCDFRLSRWDDVRQKVIDSEIGFLAESDEASVYFTGMAFDLTMLVMYHFEEGSFYQGDLIVVEEFTEPQQYVEAYRKILREMTQKYGDPIVSDILAEDETHMLEENWVEGLRLQDLVVTHYWETERSVIGLTMASDDGAIYVITEFAKQ